MGGMAKRLSGRTALITGASKRIGKALVHALAAEGADVLIHYSRSQNEAEELRGELSAYKVRAWTLRADLADPAECAGLVAKALGEAGRLDILINNASIFEPDTLETMTFQGLTRHIGINAWAPFVLTREFVRLKSGNILNILDANIARCDWTHASYILSKYLLEDLTKMTALRFAPGIRVNGIAPGLILPPAGKDETYLQSLAGTVPLKKTGRPEDIASAAIYLLTNDFLTGQIIFADGGRHLEGWSHG